MLLEALALLALCGVDSRLFQGFQVANDVGVAVAGNASGWGGDWLQVRVSVGAEVSRRPKTITLTAPIRRLKAPSIRYLPSTPIGQSPHTPALSHVRQ